VSEGMQIPTLHHTEIAEQLAVLREVVSSTTEFMNRHSPTKVLQVEVVDELVAVFQKQEEWHSCLEKPGMRFCDLILGPCVGQAWLTDRLEEAAGRLGEE
jgi:hypothetical protein